MKNIKFECDKRKDRENQKKHGVSFSEAKTVFCDESAIEYYDPDHSKDEDRFLMIGLSAKVRILLVNYLYKEGRKEDIIRIFSARKAMKNEQKVYIERYL